MTTFETAFFSHSALSLGFPLIVTPVFHYHHQCLPHHQSNIIIIIKASLQYLGEPSEEIDRFSFDHCRDHDSIDPTLDARAAQGYIGVDVCTCVCTVCKVC